MKYQAEMCFCVGTSLQLQQMLFIWRWCWSVICLFSTSLRIIFEFRNNTPNIHLIEFYLWPNNILSNSFQFIYWSKKSKASAGCFQTIVKAHVLKAPIDRKKSNTSFMIAFKNALISFWKSGFEEKILKKFQMPTDIPRILQEFDIFTKIYRIPMPTKEFPWFIFVEEACSCEQESKLWLPNN